MPSIDIIKRAIKYVIRGIPTKNIIAEIFTINYGGILNGRNIVITGGGRGIGKCIAKKCIEEGANVLITGSNEHVLQKTCSELGEACSFFVYDLSCISEINDFWKQCSLMMGGNIDSLVCNAGISLHENNILNVSVENFERQLKINLESNYFLIKSFIKEKGAKEINIICISSERGFQCDDLPYGLSKAALNSLVRGISRRFYRNGVRINGIAPGITTSDMTRRKSNDNLELERVASGRIFLGEEIAEVACFLLSNASKCISGEIIACDAGEYLSSYIS